MFMLLLLAACIVFIVVSTSRWNLHPFVSLIIAAFLFGVLSGLPAIEVISLMTEGFGTTIGKIGLLIIFGIFIGTFLEKSGAAQRLAETILNLAGKKRIHLANAVTGYLISIPVFADSGFLILSPLNQAITRKAKLSLAGTVAALALGLTASHTMVPPTPGPIAAAGLIEADLGVVFVVGLSTSLFALAACVIFSRYIGKKYNIAPANTVEVPESQATNRDAPGILRSMLPLAIPIVLILLRSIADYPSRPLGEGHLVQWIMFLGQPVVALFIGALFSLILPRKLERKIFGSDGWLGESLRDAAVIIMITGAGGTFGFILQQSALVSVLGDWISGSGSGIWIPFLMAAAFKTAQGSSTVAIITTAAIMAPVLPAMGLTGMLDKGLVVIAIGAGSAVVSHANDSFFWVLTQLSGFSVNQGYRIQTLGTAVLGGSAFIFLTILSVISKWIST